MVILSPRDIWQCHWLSQLEAGRDCWHLVRGGEGRSTSQSTQDGPSIQRVTLPIRPTVGGWGAGPALCSCALGTSRETFDSDIKN